MDESALPPAPPTTASEHRSAPPIAPTGKVYQRKKSWPMVIGIIGIVLAAVSLVVAGSTVLSYSLTPDHLIDPVQARWFTTNLVLASVSIALAALALAGAILLLRRRAGGARCLIVWALLKSVAVAVSTVAVYRISVESFEQEMQSGNAMPSGGFFLTGMPIIIAFFTLAFGLTWPVFVLIWLNKKTVKAEVATWGAPVDEAAEGAP